MSQDLVPNQAIDLPSLWYATNSLSEHVEQLSADSLAKTGEDQWSSIGKKRLEEGADFFRGQKNRESWYWHKTDDPSMWWSGKKELFMGITHVTMHYMPDGSQEDCQYIKTPMSFVHPHEHSMDPFTRSLYIAWRTAHQITEGGEGSFDGFKEPEHPPLLSHSQKNTIRAFRDAFTGFSGWALADAAPSGDALGVETQLQGAQQNPQSVDENDQSLQKSEGKGAER